MQITIMRININIFNIIFHMEPLDTQHTIQYTWDAFTNIFSDSFRYSGGNGMSLFVLLFSIFTGMVILFALDEKELVGLKNFAVISFSGYSFMCGQYWYSWNNPSTIASVSPGGFHYPSTISIIPEYGFNLSTGADGVSFPLLLLTTFIMTLCVFALSEKEPHYKLYLQLIFFIYFLLAVSFCVTNLFWFFISFESVLIPMFILIGFWGTRERKIKAAYYFFFYTLFGSFFLLYGLYYVYGLVGSFEYEVLMNFSFSYEDQLYLFFFFFIPFAIKIPMFPFHLWLPEAHVEAPTIGSVILAAILLKLGTYGFIRFTIAMFPLACSFFQDIVFVLAAASIFFASLAAIRQSDLKRMVAYASIAHMNVIVLGIFSLKHIALDGAISLMIAHGIVSAGLFFCVGILSDRYHTRDIKHYSGLAKTMPLFAFFFFLFTLGNMSFPGTSNFPGELLILCGIFENNPWIVFFAGTGIVLSAIYSIWVFNRIFFGTLKSEKQNTTNYADLNRSELLILFFLVVALIFLGVNSSFLTALTYVTVRYILKNAGSKGRK